jgi:tetratricopeptide (TPR) repeat protein
MLTVWHLAFSKRRYGRERLVMQTNSFRGTTLLCLGSSLPATAEDETFNMSATLRKAESLIRKKDYEGARRAFGEVLQRAPDDYQALYRSGWVCDQQEQYGDAVPFLQKAAKVRPKDPQPLVEQGFAETRLKHANEAIACYEAALAMRSRIFNAWHGLGDVYFDLTQNFEEATDAYLHAWRLQERDPVVNYRLGWCYNKSGQYKLAEPRLRYVADHVPKSIAAQNELAFCYLSMEHFPEACDRYRRVLALDPQNRQAMFLLGESYLGRKDGIRATAQADRLQPIDPTLAERLRLEIKRSDLPVDSRKKEHGDE